MDSHRVETARVVTAVSEETMAAAVRALARTGQLEGTGVEGAVAAAIVEAVTPLLARELRAAVAAEIRAELVCCTIYDQVAPGLATKNAAGLWAEVTDKNTRGHQLCYWGEAAARIAAGSPASGDES